MSSERFRRVLSLAGLGVSAILLVPAPALAKGSSLEPEDRFVATGEHLVLRTLFYRGAYEGRPSYGPYQVYLIPGEDYLQPDRPLPGNAVWVGQLEVSRRSSVSWIARVAFTVPSLPVGLYTIDYCNHPCTVRGMGDLSGGSLWVVNTEEEAWLAARVERLDNLVRELRARAGRYRGSARALKAQLEEERAARRALEARVEELAARLEESATAPQPQVEKSGASLLRSRWAAAAVFGVGGLGLFMFVRRWRLRPRP